MTECTSHETLVFGDSLQRTIEWIMGDAIRANTAEAWKTAADQLWGIDRLIQTMRGNKRESFVHATLAMMNLTSMAEGMAEDLKARARWDQVRSGS